MTILDSGHRQAAVSVFMLFSVVLNLLLLCVDQWRSGPAESCIGHRNLPWLKTVIELPGNGYTQCLFSWTHAAVLDPEQASLSWLFRFCATKRLIWLLNIYQWISRALSLAVHRPFIREGEDVEGFLFERRWRLTLMFVWSSVCHSLKLMVEWLESGSWQA